MVSRSGEDRPVQITALKYGADVVRMLLAWYEVNSRPFPWREPSDSGAGAIRDPWSVLVSEVMLQQTQTFRVVEALPRFLASFPDPEACAGASTAEVIRAWRGLGYNSRAVRLQQCAGEIVGRFGGAVPDDFEDLHALPGIGRYTAGAVLCFAFGREVPLVEVNVIRVLSRVFFGLYDRDDRLPERTIGELTSRLMPHGRAADWNQGLMDLGAMICTASLPDCPGCPLRTVCHSAGRVGEFELFHPVRHTRRREPRLLGRPVRLWRGMIVERLRNEPDGIVLATLLDLLLGASAGDPDARASLLDVVRRLGIEGMLVASGVVGEGLQLEEHHRVGLPG